MNFNFDTASLTKTEAQSVIALLTTLFPAAAPSSAPAPPAAPSDPPSPTPVAEQPETVQAEPKRRGRPKATSVDTSVAEPAPATVAANGASAAVVTADELRALLNSYIAKHSMEDAIAILGTFSCNRVTQALALPADKLNELAAALRG
jgi:hypothetical protein